MIVETKITALFFFGTKEESVKWFWKANSDDSTILELFFKNDAGISILLALKVQRYSIPFFHSSSHNGIELKNISAQESVLIEKPFA